MVKSRMLSSNGRTIILEKLHSSTALLKSLFCHLVGFELVLLFLIAFIDHHSSRAKLLSHFAKGMRVILIQSEIPESPTLIGHIKLQLFQTLVRSELTLEVRHLILIDHVSS